MNDNNKPTAEEIEKCANHLKEFADTLFGMGSDSAKLMAHEIETLLKAAQSTDLTTLTSDYDKSLSSMKVSADRLAEEKDHLRTQLEIEQSKVARCVEGLKEIQQLGEQSTINDEYLIASQILSSLSTTPNLVQQVKELEEELAKTKYDLELRNAME